MGLGIDKREAAGNLLAALDERLLPRGVEHDDARLQGQRGELAKVVADPQALDRNVGVAIDGRVDRDEIVLAGELQPITRKINHRDGVGAGRLGLLHEIAEALAQGVAIEVAGADHVEARGLQGLRNQAGIVGGGGKRRLGVGAVADHQCDALFLRLLGAG